MAGSTSILEAFSSMPTTVEALGPFNSLLGSKLHPTEAARAFVKLPTHLMWTDK